MKTITIYQTILSYHWLKQNQYVFCLNLNDNNNLMLKASRVVNNTIINEKNRDYSEDTHTTKKLFQRELK